MSRRWTRAVSDPQQRSGHRHALREWDGGPPLSPLAGEAGLSIEVWLTVEEAARGLSLPLAPCLRGKLALPPGVADEDRFEVQVGGTHVRVRVKILRR